VLPIFKNTKHKNTEQQQLNKKKWFESHPKPFWGKSGYCEVKIWLDYELGYDYCINIQ
jgi:hypothetical protein